MKVLIIEDDRRMVEVISLAFQIRWPEVNVISTDLGEKGLGMVETEYPDVVILDLGLPDISGFEVLKQIRLFSAVPIIISSVMGEEEDVVRGLEWGADEYIIKPFRQLEFLARIKAVIRRQQLPEEEPPIVYGSLHFGLSMSKLFYGKKEISLTRTEALILYHLMKKRGDVMTYSRFSEVVWGDDYPGATESLRVYIRRLREKLETDPHCPRLIHTKIGVGYFLEKPS